MKIMLALYHLLVFLVLIWAAALQLNDPDPVFWGGFYAFCALVSLLAVFGIGSRVLYVLCAAYGVAALALTAAGGLEYLRHAGTEHLLQGMSVEKPYIEQAREFLGTLGALALIAIYPLIKRQRVSAGA